MSACAVGEARLGGRVASWTGLPRGQVMEIQRSRLLASTVGAIDEYGYAHTSVEQITSRARVSRRTFYELFDNREGCLLALLEDVARLIEEEVAQANLGGLVWRERVRSGLWVILSFFDREPALARVCVVEAARGGPAVLRRREELLARLVEILDGGWEERSRAAQRTALTAEGLIGAALWIVGSRLTRGGEHEPLTGLLSELMSMIVLPYLGPAAARREQTRPAPELRFAAASPSGGPRGGPDALQGLPMRLTYRTARVLECIAERPGVSNRQVADLAGIADQGQVSKLLARLLRLGLTENAGEGHLKGEPNAWVLTALGLRVAQQLRVSSGGEIEAA